MVLTDLPPSLPFLTGEGQRGEKSGLFTASLGREGRGRMTRSVFPFGSRFRAAHLL